ncbi:glycine betaine/L-proline ABC transporter permease ProW [Marinobacter nanhaiticus D15-8W]|uniref:Proline/glycine betaine ABC transporter permease ProW n=1 Tax=Marinobacter nanhaiticus D15-8W TaxID=626887 RepID=N6X218_9GAMM|nr:glycine betaine/L-proline ABC transporter permease ProW [Marinobacter nanhaiticus]ENO15108.1 proline/glycine betaine ABC transporter permease ProW [Marinobacter nanhaiticus D15-8W]BES69193.1 glycine betaine/L-proline ABC transporter permease ProW [Marinobacter nanhaiticus D15-8W]
MAEQQNTPNSESVPYNESSGSNPWADASEQQGSGGTSSNPWGGAGSTEGNSDSSWLSSAESVEQVQNTLAEPFKTEWFDIQGGVENAIDWIVENFRIFFQLVKEPVDFALSVFDATLLNVPPLVMVALFGLIAWQLAGLRLGIAAAIGMIAMGAIGAWEQSMTTLSLVITSVLFCMVIGIPTGIWMAKSNRVAGAVRPILDTMQTTPAFVYLVPIVMLFGIGNVPGVIVTIIFAVAPVIRLTNLGIRQVPDDLVEASRSFGASPRQLLFKVQLPLAMPTIMAGVNQTLMLALSMVVIASMIAVPGLGLMVLRGIGRLDIGLATVGGIGIVILAIILDRMTQALGRDSRERGTRHWYESGPAGLVHALVKKKKEA